MEFKNILSVMLSAVLVFSLSGCDNENAKTESGGEQYRQPYVDADKTEKFVDTDGDFKYETVDFKVSNDYVIVYPEGNSKNEKSAKVLADFFESKYSVKVGIVTDSTAETEKEILIGKTNRSVSKNNLKENAIKVFVDGKKLIFNGGHDVTVDSAVNKFVRLAPKKGKAVTFELETDFTSSALDGYEYVWGDEFEGTTLDRTKFAYKPHMAGTGSMVVSNDEDVIKVDDGRLKLFGIRYFDGQRPGTQYKVPLSVTTINNMNFTYGYAEIRARVPYQKGAWPSFWAKSADSPYQKNDVDYNIELDIFEVFGTTDTAVPNIHKWYKKYDYNAIHGGGSHTDFPSELKKGFIFDNITNLSYEYHTYGMEWTEKEISMYIDGKKYMTFDITKSFDKYENMKGFKDYPVFLIFNNHFFTEDSSWIPTQNEMNGRTEPLIIENEELPTEYFIDYLRLYQKKGQGKIYIDDTVKD